MPLDPILAAETLKQMGAKTAADTGEGLVIPRVPFSEMPERIAKAFPELAQWNRDQNAKLEEWREKTNVVIARNTGGKGKTSTV